MSPTSKLEQTRGSDIAQVPGRCHPGLYDGAPSVGSNQISYTLWLF